MTRLCGKCDQLKETAYDGPEPWVCDLCKFGTIAETVKAEPSRAETRPQAPKRMPIKAYMQALVADAKADGHKMVIIAKIDGETYIAGGLD